MVMRLAGKEHLYQSRLHSFFVWRCWADSFMNAERIRYCVFVLVAGIQQSQADVPALLDELSRNPQEFSLLHRIESEPRDPRIIPALAPAFERPPDSRNKQSLARSLLVIVPE